ncbi:hypothetical protein ma298 [Moumouvirus australiensis]|uniref:Uncharacterized protein n=1 Tax=Moumouvirus australiensis TaxID=2109587 RepID=A0A2P1ELE0_9VIRU|nr:hypothetical protein QKC55_gp606 [Moumouvirus australiensis]AVL94684.1 hypothetical protein ma298 [Moumouvirus australiensis]
MDTLEQLNNIRKKKHQEYLQYLNKHIDNQNDQFESITKEEKISNPDNTNKAAIILQRFIRKKYFEPECINNESVKNIPPLYRFRVKITNQHINEYSEEGISPELIDMYRICYDNIYHYHDKSVIFVYCFDIRELYPIKNQLVEIYGSYYFLQPQDHINLEKLWKKINNTTTESINYINNFEYHKALSKDMYK